MRNKIRDIWNSFIHPRTWVAVLVSALSVLLLFLVISGAVTEVGLAKFTGVLSAYVALVILVNIPSEIHKKREELKKNPYTSHYFDDPLIRSEFWMYVDLIPDTIYCIIKIIIGIRYRTVWHGGEAMYYFVLTIIRLWIASMQITQHDGSPSQWTAYILSAVIMIILDLVMAVMIAQVVLRNEVYSYKSAVIWLEAGYTLWYLVHTIRKIVKFRTLNHPMISAGKALSLCKTMMSVFALQTAYLARIRQIAAKTVATANAVTGCAVVTGTVCVSVYMVVHGKRELFRTVSENH